MASENQQVAGDLPKDTVILVLSKNADIVGQLSFQKLERAIMQMTASRDWKF